MRLILFAVLICIASQSFLRKFNQDLKWEKKSQKQKDLILLFKRTNNFRAGKTPRNYVVRQAKFPDKEIKSKNDKATWSNN